ncbi:hypothetical protein ATY77_21000 [Rhizobium sp. R634]|uniref:hypothetical protein n=1 Tax=Rhizobium sp. R634 TaxID=1764274 RepID=UPI000B53731B|nr:hypothetical protein [Rhizobium sp. R634]OWV69645.1 hypothetical protein ATY77_21000 [Rhizobium sp. R634]
MRGDPPNDREPFRYVKFAWDDLSNLPPVGKLDYGPKGGGAFRMFEEGTIEGTHIRAFPAIKKKENLPALGQCVYCHRKADDNGKPLKLTSEHVIPEFLGVGLELPAASCAECQKATADFESAIATSMFDPVRKMLLLKGKGGVLEKTNFPLDVGRETTRHEFIPLRHYPTILLMPNFFPAASYSRRSPLSDDLFNILMFNINAEPEYLKQYALEDFSTQAIDLVHFSQMIAKIAHVYGTHRFEAFRPTVADFVRTTYPPGSPVLGHLEHVGCLWQRKLPPTDNLHEIEVGAMHWQGKAMTCIRVQLFAAYGMRSYYVTIGE